MDRNLDKMKQVLLYYILIIALSSCSSEQGCNQFIKDFESRNISYCINENENTQMKIIECLFNEYSKDTSASMIYTNMFFHEKAMHRYNMSLSRSVRDHDIMRNRVVVFFIISAIFYENLDFRFIMDLQGTNGKSIYPNDHLEIDKIEHYYQDWIKEMKEKGIKKLRKDNIYPLKNSGYKWR